MAYPAPPQPDAHALLPSLLACLPASFASSRPPPALLSLLSPILRQRLHIFTSASSASAHENWIRLLCWDSSKAEVLKETVENANFEPHPASGEIEIGDVGTIRYKRFDAETLRARIPLLDWSLTAIYLWCTNKEEGNAWRLAEMLPYDSSLDDDSSWSMSIAEAQQTSQVAQTAPGAPAKTNGNSLFVPGQEDDEDDYWAQYDKTPGRTPAVSTPARKASVVPNGGKTSEDDYYARYRDVQPAMDNYDPDEQQPEHTESTLQGDGLRDLVSHASQAEDRHDSGDRALPTVEEDSFVPVSHPVPSSPSSRASDTVARLEETADRYSASEIAIKQHISTSVKSMYRLAKGAGMSRTEFEDMVQRELETLSIFDRDD